MKYILFTLMLVSLAFQAAFAQSNVNNKALSFMIKPKMGNSLQFEQKLAAFAKTHFKGGNEYRIQQVNGGSHDGSYIMSRPKFTSYAYYDSEQFQKENGPFWADFEKEVMPYMESIQMMFLNFLEGYSTVAPGSYTAKNYVTERYVKHDKMQEYLKILSVVKPVWASLGYQTAIYRNATGPTNRFVIIRRLSTGWGDLDQPDPNKVRDAFIKLYSAEKWAQHEKTLAECTESVQSYFQYYRADLSNK
jgi:hypothetical protein